MLDSQQLGQLMRAFPALADLPAEIRTDVARNGRIMTAPAGACVFEVGARCDAYLLVVAGVLRMVHSSPEGREQVLYRVQAGDLCVLTTACLLGGVPYPARGVIDADVTAVAIERDLFLAWVDRSRAVRAMLFLAMADRVQRLMQLVSDVTFRRLDERLATVLLSGGERVHATHDALAAELGTAREMVSRILKSFEREGLLVLARGQIAILDRPGLARIAAGQA